MICKQCGTENKAGVKFCKKCGQPLSANPTASPKIVAPASRKPPVNSKVIGIIAGAAVAVVGAVLCVKLLGDLGPTIDLDKYLVINASGYEGYGTVDAYVDWNAVEEKYGDKLKLTKGAKEEYGELSDLFTPVDILSEYTNVVPDKRDNLSNGEDIEYSWRVEEEQISRDLNCKVKYSDGNYKVSGLQEIGTFDAFAGLEVTFSGSAPNGTVSLNYSGSELSEYDFSCDKSSGLSNGDVVVVYIDDNKIQKMAERLGKIPEISEAEYTVDGLVSDLVSVADIDQASLEAMQKQAEEEYYAHMAKSWGEEEALDSFDYIGNYFLTVKDSDTWGDKNALYLVYKAKVHPYFEKDGEVYDQASNIYWYIKFSNLKLNADGSVDVNLSNGSTPSDRTTIDSGISNGWFSNKNWYYYGYESLDDLYKKVVTANANNYNHEDSITDLPDTTDQDNDESSENEDLSENASEDAATSEDSNS